jgi:hypothetical protein
MGKTWRQVPVLAFLFSLLFVAGLFAQETTAGLQGTVKDPSGAVVPGAKIVLSSSNLVGGKETNSDSNGYYHFSNLPPGNYVITATKEGFVTLKREGVTLEVGHLPNLDLPMQVGGTGTVVEVTEEAPLIDVTTTRTMTNITQDVLNDVPHGRSFQSVIQFAPSARNEPLMASTTNGSPNGGTGGSLPGSSGNGASVGFSIGGASDSENSYLVEGQDTENISGGYSKANVPYQFIQEVQIKTSGIEAEHGGSLGGVANVIMKKGSNSWHGEGFFVYEGSGANGNDNAQYLRYDPTAVPSASGVDPGTQIYSPKKDSFHLLQPGFTIGGPIVKDKLWFFAGFAPLIDTLHRTVNFNDPSNPVGVEKFTQSEKQYYTTARLDYALSQKVKLFGSWLYQYSRENGARLPTADPLETGILNTAILSPLAQYAPTLGWSAPNATYNVGADISLTNRIVATTRYGYFFENYHDFGWPTTSPDLSWVTNGKGALDNGGNPLPAGLAVNSGTSTQPYNQSYTLYNSNKHYQFDQDIAFFKSGWGGTHNFKFGYQLNHLVNLINQNGNVPFANLAVGQGASYSPLTSTGAANCATLATAWGACAGQYGYLQVVDFATIEPHPASDYNHSIFAQDAWTIGHGVTINAGIRVEKESLPAPTGVNIRTINFGWGDKIAPRVGAAWDPFRNGKMKIFGNYGVFNDIMKLLVAETSFGAQAYEECTYALGPNSTAGFNVSDINLVYANNRACPSASPTTGANFAGGTTPTNLVDAKTGVSLIENINLRPYEPVMPNLKPYRQHESSFGVDYAVTPTLGFEARWDRRRLDHVIEDASLADPTWGEIYTIVNPGEGVNKTINGYANFLASLGQGFGFPGMAFSAPGATPFGTCANCPNNPKAVRSYDGLEFRLNKAATHGLSGMVSYTWSRLYGNYTGLTTTDQTDGGNTGRNSPDTSRSFDEPFYYFGANGKSNNGPLPTDRPNTFKGYAYYEAPWGHGHGMTTTFGLFQVAYQGSPVSSYADLGTMFGQQVSEATYLYGRGKWVNATADPTTGLITLGNAYDRRTPWFTQSDFNFIQAVKVNKNHENQVVAFELNILNLLNQHTVTAYYGGLNSTYQPSPLLPGGLSLYQGAATYQQYETGYNIANAISSGGTKFNSQYGQPFSYQLARNMRFTVRFNF